MFFICTVKCFRTIEQSQQALDDRVNQLASSIQNIELNAIEKANNALEVAAKIDSPINKLNFKESLNSAEFIAPKKLSKNTSAIVQKAKSKSMKM